MTEPNLRTIFYALPLPLSNPGINARLAGMALMSIGDGVSLDAPNFKRLLTCSLAPHVALSPAYLLRQGIDPNNLRHGLTALNFMQQLEEMLKPRGSSDVLVSFALRHLTSYNAMALQNFFAPTLLERFGTVVDLKVALDTCFYFGQTQVKSRKSLPEAVRALGYTGPVAHKLERLDAMFFLYQYLNRHDPKIMAFLHHTKRQRMDLVAKTLRSEQPYLVYIDDKGALQLIRLLAQSADGRVVKVIATDGAHDTLHCLNLDVAPLVAPCGILTAERQAALKFDLEALKARLSQLEVSALSPQAEHSSPSSAPLEHFTPAQLPFYDAFTQSLTEAEQATFARLSRHDLRTETNLAALCNPERKLGQMTMCYLNENFPQAMMAGERAQYERYCRRLAQSRADSVLQELQHLAQMLPEDDAQQGDLLRRIAGYF